MYRSTETKMVQVTKKFIEQIWRPILKIGVKNYVTNPTKEQLMKKMVENFNKTIYQLNK